MTPTMETTRLLLSITRLRAVVMLPDVQAAAALCRSGSEVGSLCRSYRARVVVLGHFRGSGESVATSLRSAAQASKWQPTR